MKTRINIGINSDDCKTISDRIRVLDHFALASYKEYVKLTSIPEV